MNLSSVEILMLHYLNEGIAIDNLPKQKFWRDKYNTSPQLIINSLMKKSYIYVDSDIDKSLNYITVKELKDILRNNDLLVSGNKNELISRIKESEIDSNQYIKDFYILTGEAKEIVKNTKEIMDIHNSSSGDISLYNPPRFPIGLMASNNDSNYGYSLKNIFQMLKLLFKSIYLGLKLLFYPLIFLANLLESLNNNFKKKDKK